jgi:plasmid stability protein
MNGEKPMTLTIELPEDEIALLNAKADAEGLSAAQCARQLLQQALSSPGAKRPLAARIREIWAGMPDEVRAKAPADGAGQHDHYMYGVPKRAQ